MAGTVFERIPRGQLGYGTHGLQEPLADVEGRCETDRGHRLRISGEKIECLLCGAEWKDLKTA